MGSKRSKRSRRDKRNSQRAPLTDAVTCEVAMKLEQCEIPDTIEPDTVDEGPIDGVVLDDPVSTPPRASCIPVLCRTPSSVVGTGRSYMSIRRVSEELLPMAAKPSRIPRWAAASVSVSDSSVSSGGGTTLSLSRSVTATPDQTAFSYDDDCGARTSTSSMSSLSSVEDPGCYSTEPATVMVSLDNKEHGIKMELGIELAMPSAPGGALILSAITVPE